MTIRRPTRWSERHNEHEPSDEDPRVEIERALLKTRTATNDESRSIKIARLRWIKAGAKGYATLIVRSEIDGSQRGHQRNGSVQLGGSTESSGSSLTRARLRSEP